MYPGRPSRDGNGERYRIDAAMAASSGTKSADVCDGGTVDKLEARDRVARRCAAAAKADRMMTACDSRPYYGRKVLRFLRRCIIFGVARGSITVLITKHGVVGGSLAVLRESCLWKAIVVSLNGLYWEQSR